MCRIIDDLPAGTSKLIKTFAAASLYYNYSSTEKCFNIGKGSTDTHGLHGWDWQVCIIGTLFLRRYKSTINLFICNQNPRGLNLS